MAEGASYRKKGPKEGKGGKYMMYVMVIFISLAFIFMMVFGLVALATGASVPFSKCVAVVEISGPLTVEETPASLFEEGMAGSYGVAKRIEAIDEREDVGAVLFVINSPGGSVVATNEIYRAIDGLEKPKVAYFREMAASGGYYVATPADYIVSEPNALTGSIGVIMAAYEMEGLFDKLGIREVPVKSGEMKDIGTPFRNMSEKEYELLMDVVEETFEEFKSVILLHRGDRLNRALFEEALDGRVLSGRMALRAGLVDALGSRDDALERAAELGGISYEGEVPVCYVDVNGREAGLFSMGSILGSIGAEGNGYSLEYR